MERKIVPDSIIYSDSWKGYNVLDVSAFKHFRINYSEPFADKQNHIKGIESFWSQAKPSQAPHAYIQWHQTGQF